MTKPARYLLTLLLLALVISLLSVAAGLYTLGPTSWRGAWGTEFGGSASRYFYIYRRGTVLHLGSREWRLPLTHFELVLASLFIPATVGLIAAGMVIRSLFSPAGAAQTVPGGSAPPDPET